MQAHRPCPRSFRNTARRENKRRAPPPLKRRRQTREDGAKHTGTRDAHQRTCVLCAVHVEHRACFFSPKDRGTFFFVSTTCSRRPSQQHIDNKAAQRTLRAACGRFAKKEREMGSAKQEGQAMAETRQQQGKKKVTAGQRGDAHTDTSETETRHSLQNWVHLPQQSPATNRSAPQNFSNTNRVIHRLRLVSHVPSAAVLTGPQSLSRQVVSPRRSHCHLSSC